MYKLAKQIYDLNLVFHSQEEIKQSIKLKISRLLQMINYLPNTIGVFMVLQNNGVIHINSI